MMGLQGVELILCGYNTPIHYVPDPSQDILQGFHNALVMQSGAYQNGTWVVGVAKGGVEEGVDSLGADDDRRPERPDRRPGVHDRRRADRRPLRPRLVQALHRARCSTSTATAAPSCTAGSPRQRGVVRRNRCQTEPMPLFDRHDDDTPLTLVGLEFSDAFRAQEFLTAATRLAVERPPQVEGCGVRGRRRREARRSCARRSTRRPGRSAVGGAFWTGLFGLLLGGPIGWIGGMAIGAGGRRGDGEVRRPRDPRRVGRLVPPGGAPRHGDPRPPGHRPRRGRTRQGGRALQRRRTSSTPTSTRSACAASRRRSASRCPTTASTTPSDAPAPPV